MIELPHIEHHIQKHILSHLMASQLARFRDMRPPQTDSNLYSYHLKLLIKQGLVEKSDQGYALTILGQVFVDRVNLTTTKRTLQPKIITMLIIQDGYGNILMYTRRRQPFIGLWTLPLGKVHNADASIQKAAQREVIEKISGDHMIKLRHAGDAYIRMKQGDEVFMSTLAHVFHGQTDEISEPNERWRWVSPRALDGLETSPAITQIISRTFFHDPYFFEEYDVQWQV